MCELAPVSPTNTHTYMHTNTYSLGCEIVAQSQALKGSAREGNRPRHERVITCSHQSGPCNFTATKTTIQTDRCVLIDNGPSV